ncbi:hypothetical protein KDAU_12430 [Dictyobacter aurantiacus]|uniref:Uncharacterized protein n=1 Tax=Dictyobacter aurantiacus TaxID=1936993 RepID=A0A401ZAL6_9CHLR|nr:hypothetical protein KDAU_12430 [Dictyobacter aurantiacus]
MGLVDPGDPEVLVGLAGPEVPVFPRGSNSNIHLVWDLRSFVVLMVLTVLRELLLE